MTNFSNFEHTSEQVSKVNGSQQKIDFSRAKYEREREQEKNSGLDRNARADSLMKNFTRFGNEIEALMDNSSSQKFEIESSTEVSSLSDDQHSQAPLSQKNELIKKYQEEYQKLKDDYPDLFQHDPKSSEPKLVKDMRKKGVKRKFKNIFKSKSKKRAAEIRFREAVDRLRDLDKRFTIEYLKKISNERFGEINSQAQIDKKRQKIINGVKKELLGKPDQKYIVDGYPFLYDPRVRSKAVAISNEDIIIEENTNESTLTEHQKGKAEIEIQKAQYHMDIADVILTNLQEKMQINLEELKENVKSIEEGQTHIVYEENYDNFLRKTEEEMVFGPDAVKESFKKVWHEKYQEARKSKKPIPEISKADVETLRNGLPTPDRSDIGLILRALHTTGLNVSSDAWEIANQETPDFIKESFISAWYAKYQEARNSNKPIPEISKADVETLLNRLPIPDRLGVSRILQDLQTTGLSVSSGAWNIANQETEGDQWIEDFFDSM